MQFVALLGLLLHFRAVRSRKRDAPLIVGAAAGLVAAVR
jgi:hypothetical protein